MISISISDLLTITGGTLLCGNAQGTIDSITTDSRTVQEGALFVAICGQRVDGHSYIDTAFSKGATCVLAEREVEVTGEKPVILVPDTVGAMGAIARYVMETLAIPTVAITGSVGKTTTRDMTHAVLCAKFHTLKNENNFNNEIGVPLTVFKADESYTAAVIEMGMDNFGEIHRLSQMVMPDIAMVTNIGMSHIERLGSQENIYKAKSEMFANTKPAGVVILNGDDPILMKHKHEIAQKVITVGVKNKNADLLATNICADAESVSFDVMGMGHSFSVKLPVPGEHNVLNALLACAAGLVLEIPDQDIKDALSSFTLTGMRMDIVRCQSVTVINDCYNAAPASVSAALGVLAKRTNRKVAILGDIAALGEYSYSAHKDLGAVVVDSGVDFLITIGQQAKYIAEGAFERGMDSTRFVSVDTVEEVYPYLSENLKENDVILVKASRVMGLERVTEYLKQNF